MNSLERTRRAFSKTPLLPSVKEFANLKVPDPESALGMSTMLEAACLLMERVGDSAYVQANVNCGPFSVAAILRGGVHDAS